ncbi:MAG TPA: hypothetical protein VM324_06215 [Egibacteraceae bacterium]|nr:hypothetical protein [Egibacteraceae bacterium]
MRGLATADRIRVFLRELGRHARHPARAHLAGGATAVLLGWRDATIDVDLAFAGPGGDALLRAIPALKDALRLNVELATPADFIPLPADWREHGRFETQEGRLVVYHVELVWQALAKIHRGHRQDLEDARTMVTRGLVAPDELRAAFTRIEPELFRFPNIDPPSFRRAVERFTAA